MLPILGQTYEVTERNGGVDMIRDQMKIANDMQKAITDGMNSPVRNDLPNGENALIQYIRQLPDDQALSQLKIAAVIGGWNKTEDQLKDLIYEWKHPGESRVSKLIPSFKGWKLPADTTGGFANFFLFLLAVIILQRGYWWWRHTPINTSLGRRSWFHPLSLIYISGFNFFLAACFQNYSPWLSVFAPIAALQIWFGRNEILKGLIKGLVANFICTQLNGYAVGILIASIIYLWVYHRTVFEKPGLILTNGGWSDLDAEMSPQEHYEVLRNFCDSLRPARNRIAS